MNIISAFNIPYSPPESVRPRIKLLGYSFIEDISNLLETHGLSAPIKWGDRLTSEEQLEAIKNHLDQDQPVLAAIGNGYLGRDFYSPLARHLIGHYITIYGYSEQNELIYIYDSSLKGEYPDEIPAGNETRTYQQFIRDWTGPVYYRLIGMKNIYIPVTKR